MKKLLFVEVSEKDNCEGCPFIDSNRIGFFCNLFDVKVGDNRKNIHKCISCDTDIEQEIRNEIIKARALRLSNVSTKKQMFLVKEVIQTVKRNFTNYLRKKKR